MSGRQTEEILKQAMLIEDEDDELETSLAMIIQGISEHECNFRQRNQATRKAMTELIERIDELTVERDELLQECARLKQKDSRA